MMTLENIKQKNDLISADYHWGYEKEKGHFVFDAAKQNIISFELSDTDKKYYHESNGYIPGLSKARIAMMVMTRNHSADTKYPSEFNFIQY
ncbi:MAG: hypothetical protein PUF49_08465 [Firmicutes bacterium]|nr:hypothetical protein [Bacillota bacterium]